MERQQECHPRPEVREEGLRDLQEGHRQVPAEGRLEVRPEGQAVREEAAQVDLRESSPAEAQANHLEDRHREQKVDRQADHQVNHPVVHLQGQSRPNHTPTIHTITGPDEENQFPQGHGPE